jgi:dTDP-4-dehydrorhamnose 3,5-epimerase
MKVDHHPYLRDVKIITPDVFSDYRGENWPSYEEKYYDAIGCPKFVKDNFSYSTKNVIRGLHGDEITWKLITCVSGRFLLALVDCDSNSISYRMKDTFLLDDKKRTQILVPNNFANGHLCLSDSCIFYYKWSQYYDAEGREEFTVNWENNIDWPLTTRPILSERDEYGPFKEIEVI